MSKNDTSKEAGAVNSNEKPLTVVNSTLYSKMEQGGLKYIKNQRNYILLSAIVPILSIVVQIVNVSMILVFSLGFFDNARLQQGDRPPIGGLYLFDVLSPILIVFIFFIISMIHFFYLYRWKRRVFRYENQERIVNEATTDENRITLTQLFYDILDNMETIRKIFIALNIISIFYLQWFFRFFLKELFFIINPRPDLNPLRYIIPSINLGLQLLLIIYLIVSWKHFIKWNSKLNKIKTLEQQIYEEINMDSQLLVIYGDQEELEEVQELIAQQDRNFQLKVVPIPSDETFTQKLEKLIQDSK